MMYYGAGEAAIQCYAAAPPAHPQSLRKCTERYVTEIHARDTDPSADPSTDSAANTVPASHTPLRPACRTVLPQPQLPMPGLFRDQMMHGQIHSRHSHAGDSVPDMQNTLPLASPAAAAGVGTAAALSPVVPPPSRFIAPVEGGGGGEPVATPQQQLLAQAQLLLQQHHQPQQSRTFSPTLAHAAPPAEAQAETPQHRLPPSGTQLRIGSPAAEGLALQLPPSTPANHAVAAVHPPHQEALRQLQGLQVEEQGAGYGGVASNLPLSAPCSSAPSAQSTQQPIRFGLQLHASVSEERERERDAAAAVEESTRHAKNFSPPPSVGAVSSAASSSQGGPRPFWGAAAAAAPAAQPPATPPPLSNAQGGGGWCAARQQSPARTGVQQGQALLPVGGGGGAVEGSFCYVADSVAKARIFSPSRGVSPSPPGTQRSSGGASLGVGDVQQLQLQHHTPPPSLTSLCHSLRAALLSLREDIDGLDVQRLQMNASFAASAPSPNPKDISPERRPVGCPSRQA